jgi:DNA-binding response OmpR family regulator
MAQLRILVFSQSGAMVDEFVLELSHVLSAIQVQRVVGSPEVAAEWDREEITASIVCVRGAEEEPWVTSLLQSLRQRSTRIPIFAVTAKNDAHLQLRLLELGASGCTSTAAELSRLVVQLFDVLRQRDEDCARAVREADISRTAPCRRRCRSGLSEPPAPAEKPPV